MDIPVSVTTHDIEVTVNETVVDVLVTATVQTIAVTVEYGLSATQVQALLTKENITGLKETDSPEFVDTTIPALNSVTNGGSVSAADYDWFKGVYSSLIDGSVISWIKGLLSVGNGLSVRIGLLENPIIYNQTITEDVTSVLIEGIEINEGIPLDIILSCGANSSSSNYMLLIINNISTKNYLYSTSLYPGLMIPCGNEYFTTKIRLELSGGNVVAEISYIRSHNGTKMTSDFAVGAYNLNINAITSLRFVATAGAPYLPKQKIIIRK